MSSVDTPDNYTHDTLFEIFLQHLVGVSAEPLQAQIKALTKTPSRRPKSILALYQSTTLSPDEIAIIRLLLHVPQDLELTATSFLGVIEELSRARHGYRHLEDFEYLLKQAEPYKNWRKIIGLSTLSLASTGVFVGISANLAPVIQEIINKTFKFTISTLTNTPLVLLVYNSIFILYQSIYSVYYDTFKTPEKRLQNWLAGTIRPTFSLSAYAISLASKHTLPLAAMTCIIASSLVDVINSLWNYYHLMPVLDAPDETAPIGERLNYIRQKERFERTHQIVCINLVASLIVATIVILLELFPPTFFFLNLVAISSLLAVNLMGSHLVQKGHAKGAEKLQKALMIELNKPPLKTTSTRQAHFFSDIADNDEPLIDCNSCSL